MLRVVRKLQDQLALSGDESDASGALGDWYVKRFVMRRQPLLMIVSSTSLLACIERAQDVRSLPRRLPGIVAHRLTRLGIGQAVIESEIAAMQPVSTGPTIDRTVVGAMVNYCQLMGFNDSDGPVRDTEIEAEEAFLWQTPMLTSNNKRVSFYPEDTARQILEWRWSAGR